MLFSVWVQFAVLLADDLWCLKALARAQSNSVGACDTSPHWRSPIDLPANYTPTHHSVSLQYHPWEAVALQHTSVGLQINLRQAFNSFSISDSSDLSSIAGRLRLGEMVRARDGSGPGNFVLTRLELRAPSAHRLAGNSSLVELQLWHEAEGDAGKVPRAQDSNSAVISILLDPVLGGPSLPLLAQLSDALEAPLPPTSTRFLHGGPPLDLGSLVKHGSGLLRYEGAEIAPPCRRGVVWLIADHVTSVEANLLQRLAFHLRIATQLPLAAHHWPLGERSLFRLVVNVNDGAVPSAASRLAWCSPAAAVAICFFVLLSWLSGAAGS